MELAVELASCEGGDLRILKKIKLRLGTTKDDLAKGQQGGSIAHLGLVYSQGSDGVEPKETAPLEGDQQQGDERVPPPRFRPRYRR